MTRLFFGILIGGILASVSPQMRVLFLSVWEKGQVFLPGIQQNVAALLG